MEIHEQDLVILSFPFDLFGNSGAGEGARKIASFAEKQIRALGHKSARDSSLQAVSSNIKFLNHEFKTTGDYTSWQSQLINKIKLIREKRALPLVCGGNHLSLLPLYYYYMDNEQDVAMVTLDAHYDLSRKGTEQGLLNHANFLYYVVQKKKLPICHLGSRIPFSGAQLAAYGIKFIPARDIALADFQDVYGRLQEDLGGVSAIHIDIDLDVFSSARFKASQTPVPCGINDSFFIKLIHHLLQDYCIRGFSFSEYNPLLDDKQESGFWFYFHTVLLCIREYFLAVKGIDT